MNVDIKNIASKKPPFWRPIYEVFENSYFTATKLFPTYFLDQCRNNPDEPQKIPNEIKASLKKMATEHCLYAKVVMTPRKESENKN